jgi:hypothetical protein
LQNLFADSLLFAVFFAHWEEVGAQNKQKIFSVFRSVDGKICPEAA